MGALKDRMGMTAGDVISISVLLILLGCNVVAFQQCTESIRSPIGHEQCGQVNEQRRLTMNPTNCQSYEREGRGRFDEPVWEKRGDDRCCSYCGSMHPDDVREFLKTVDHIENMVVETTKRYKFYINRKGVVNASQGGIKFYTWHLQEHNSEDRELYKDLVEAAQRFMAARNAEPN